MYVAGLGIEPGTSALESDALPTALRGPAVCVCVCVCVCEREGVLIQSCLGGKF